MQTSPRPSLQNCINDGKTDGKVGKNHAATCRNALNSEGRCRCSHSSYRKNNSQQEKKLSAASKDLESAEWLFLFCYRYHQHFIFLFCFFVYWRWVFLKRKACMLNVINHATLVIILESRWSIYMASFVIATCSVCIKLKVSFSWYRSNSELFNRLVSFWFFFVFILEVNVL